MTKKPEPQQPTTLDEAKRIVEREFLGTNGIHAVGKKISRNAVRVYTSVSSPALDAALGDIKSRCAPFQIDVVIEEQPSAGTPRK